jgi:hypothetical protein
MLEGYRDVRLVPSDFGSLRLLLGCDCSTSIAIDFNVSGLLLSPIKSFVLLTTG